MDHAFTGLTLAGYPAVCRGTDTVQNRAGLGPRTRTDWNPEINSSDVTSLQEGRHETRAQEEAPVFHTKELPRGEAPVSDRESLPFREVPLPGTRGDSERGPRSRRVGVIHASQAPDRS